MLRRRLLLVFLALLYLARGPLLQALNPTSPLPLALRAVAAFAARSIFGTLFTVAPEALAVLEHATGWSCS